MSFHVCPREVTFWLVLDNTRDWVLVKEVNRDIQEKFVE